MGPEEHPASRPAGAAGWTTNHLANGQTCLVWVRTALGLIGLGFVLARMGLFLRQLAITADPAHVHVSRSGHEFLITCVVFLLLEIATCA